MEIKLETAFDWCGQHYETLELDFSKLTGSDVAAAEAELYQNGHAVDDYVFDTDFLLRMVSRAGDIPEDALEQLSGRDFAALRPMVQVALLQGEQESGVTAENGCPVWPGTVSAKGKSYGPMTFDLERLTAKRLMAMERELRTRRKRVLDYSDNRSFLQLCMATAAGVPEEAVEAMPAMAYLKVRSGFIDFFTIPVSGRSKQQMTSEESS